MAGDTRLQAHAQIQPHLTRLQGLVLDAFELYRDGLCAFEVEAVTSLRQSTVSARVNELVAAGLLVDSGARRKTRSGRSAAVYRVRK